MPEVLQVDSAPIAAAAVVLGATVDQVPFAMSVALNEAAKDTAALIADVTWPAHVKVRNPGFLKAALRIENSTKRSLTVSIYDRLGRANLLEHAQGGVVTPRSSTEFAIPTTSSGITKGPGGIPAGQRPQQLKNTFRRGNALYQRQPNGKLKLMYIFKQAVQLKPTVPMYEDFARYMARSLVMHLPDAVKRAMETRIKQVSK